MKERSCVLFLRTQNAARSQMGKTFTCTPHVDAALFRKVVLGAAVDAGRAVLVLQHLGPGPDHAVALGHPEGEYLRGLLVRVP